MTAMSEDMRPNRRTCERCLHVESVGLDHGIWLCADCMFDEANNEPPHAEPDTQARREGRKS